MSPNPQIPADLVTFTEEILDGKPHLLCSAQTLTNLFTFTQTKLSFV